MAASSFIALAEEGGLLRKAQSPDFTPSPSHAPATTQENYDRAMARLRDSTTPYARWRSLGDAAIASALAGHHAEAETLATELQQQAPNHHDDWNYGNAIHDSHLALGLTSLQQGNTAKASQHLLEAGRTPGSPQLNSFGPNMLLADALLHASQQEIVCEYLQLCRNFWKMGHPQLTYWTQRIKLGQHPDFRPNLRH